MEFTCNGITGELGLGGSVRHSLPQPRHPGHQNERIHTVDVLALSVHETHSPPERGVVIAPPFSLSMKETTNQGQPCQPQAKPGQVAQAHAERWACQLSWAELAVSERWLCHPTFCDGLSGKYSPSLRRLNACSPAGGCLGRFGRWGWLSELCQWGQSWRF